MAAIKYKVKLAESERSRLNEVSHRGKPSVRTVKRALALLKADEGLRDREVAGALLINAATVARVRKRFVEEGLEAAINDKPRPGRERKLDGKQEAHLVAQDDCKVFFYPLMVSLSNHRRIERASFDKLRMSRNR